tara:strand:+ start:128 stop:1003 length:876 start_codon:yes stop_codon:yes gene_type:complete
MAFKMRSGNKVSFKNMGSSSPGKQSEFESIPSLGPEKLDVKLDDKPLEATKTFEETSAEIKKEKEDLATNKEVGDKKTESHFDFTDALKGFLESGGGKEGLLKGIGAGISKKSPNEKLAIQKARDIRKAKKDANQAKIKKVSSTTETENEKKPKGKGWIKKAGEWVREEIVEKVQQAIINKKDKNQVEFDKTQETEIDTTTKKNKEVIEKAIEREEINKLPLLDDKPLEGATNTTKKKNEKASQKDIDAYNAEEKIRADAETTAFRAKQAAETIEYRKNLAKKIWQSKIRK